MIMDLFALYSTWWNVIFDLNSYNNKYRQHDRNVCGGRNSLFRRFYKSGFKDKFNIRHKIYNNKLI